MPAAPPARPGPSFTPADYRGRLSRLQSLLRRKRLDAAVLGSTGRASPNTLYYSGEWNAPSLQLVFPDETVMFSGTPEAFSFYDQSLPLHGARKHLLHLLKKKRATRVGVDEAVLGGLAFRLAAHKRFAVAPLANDLTDARALKDAKELRCIELAQSLTKRAVADALARGVDDHTENELAGFLELHARTNGAALDAFPPIVISGAKTAIPHATPGNARVGRNLLLFDVGARVNGYCADYSHTVYGGRDKRIRDALEAVREAKKAAERLAKPGVKGKRLNDAALRVLKDYGFENDSHKKAGLSLGHFVGLQVHDGTKNLDAVTLAKGMAFTIEPGVYVPGRFGVRFEDVVVLR